MAQLTAALGAPRRHRAAAAGAALRRRVPAPGHDPHRDHLRVRRPSGSTIDVSASVPHARLSGAPRSGSRRESCRRSSTSSTSADQPATAGRLLDRARADGDRRDACSGWFIAGRVLRPLASDHGTARTISAGNLRRAPGTDRPRRRVQAARRHARRSARAARDVVRGAAALRGQRLARAAHAADRRPDAAAGRARRPERERRAAAATCEELLASGREQERLLEALLTLASSERGLEQREPLDLAAIADRALLAAGAGSVTTSLAPAPTSGDPALIERLIANLLDNALRYNDERGIVEMSTGSDDEEAYVTVCNTGSARAGLGDSATVRTFPAFGERTADG